MRISVGSMFNYARYLAGYWDEVARMKKLGIRPSDLVLEIGAGNGPYFRSDILCDRYLSDNTERASRGSIRIDRPFVAGDAMNLPFRSQTVDFLIANQLLEHLERPGDFLDEIVRVSKRGYLTTPTELAEKIFGWEMHLWYVEVKDGVLTLRRKERPIYDSQLAKTFHALYSLNHDDNAFHRFYWAYPELFICEFVWEGRINYQIEEVPSPREERVKTRVAQFDLIATLEFLRNYERAIRGLSYKQRVGQWLDRALRHVFSRHRAATALDWLAILACPVCLSGLEMEQSQEQALVCTSCRQRYPVMSGIPVLVTEAAPQREVQESHRVECSKHPVS